MSISDKPAMTPGGVGMGMISPRKRMGMGDVPSGASDIEEFSSMMGRVHMDIKGTKTVHREMKDSERNRPIGRRQANPQHGPDY